MTPPWVWWILLASASAPVAVHSLSSHSPRDLYSHPQFKVVVSEQVVLNDTIPNLLSQAKTASDDIANAHILRIASGQAFLCTVPSVSEDEVEHSVKETTKDAVALQEERERGLENGLALLEPLRTQCLYSKKNWFTYSFCYGKHIRQFHELRVAGSVEPVEDVNNWSYTLGRYPAPQPAIEKASPPRHVGGGGGGGGAGNNNGRANPAALAPGATSAVSTRAPGTLGGGPEMGLGDDEGGLYLTQIWDDGTICDKTGLPREVEVQVRIPEVEEVGKKALIDLTRSIPRLQFHCNTQTIDRIALIRETAICRYVMIIHTPRLCSEPVFLERQRASSSSDKGPSAIECRPVVRHLRESVDAPKVPTGPPIVREDYEEVLAGHRLPKKTNAKTPDAVQQQQPQQKPPPKQVAPEEIAADVNAPSKAGVGTAQLPLEEWGESIDLELVYDPMTGQVVEAAIIPLAEDGAVPTTPPFDQGPDEGQPIAAGQGSTFDEMKDNFLAQLDGTPKGTGKKKGEEVDEKEDDTLDRLERMQELAKALNALLQPGDAAGVEGQVPAGNAAVAGGAAGGGGVGQGGARIIKPIMIPVDTPGGLAGAVKAALEQIKAQPGITVGGGRDGPPSGPIGYDGDEDVGKKGLEEVKVSKEYERLTEAFGRKWEEDGDEEAGEEGQERKRDEL
ncbi:BQ2448_5327 [Microbotryum intermedium]|uniref:Protein OS-9 homolog n=1 Tax=Microbotryum intermedium TaxID=269621 RepID=A0A238F9G5_9BASI|nr:BQ2448_5327 [Microbotryum intermedium]